MRKSILFATLVLLLSFTGSLAQIPRTINYQGVLTDAGGEAVPDGNYNLTFRIYNTASGGTALWTEGLLVSVSKGIFNVTLGKVVPLTLPFDDQYWLGITVGAAAELSPRVEFTSSAYSMIAHTVVDDAVTGDKISNGSVVRSVNTLTDQVTLSAGTNMSITPSGNTLVFSSSGTGALDLPYNDSVTSGSTAFGITNYGTGRAGSFLISNATNSNQAVYAETNGTGRAGHFRITNAANDLESVAASTVGGGAALSGYTVGGGDALSAQTDGGGRAGYFRVNNASNADNAVEVTTNGTGGGVDIRLTNASGSGKALYVENSGGGRAGHFRITNASNNSTSVAASTTGGGVALIGYTTGTGNAAEFEINNTESYASACYAETNARHPSACAGEFVYNNDTGWGYALKASSNSSDYVAYFRTYGGTPGVHIYTEGATGLLVSGGTKNAAMPTSQGVRALYCEEATEVWFTDYGFGRLDDGKAVIGIDPLFAETVSLDRPYHVFVQAYGDAELYVNNRAESSFEVHARNGKSDVDAVERTIEREK